MKRRKQLFSKNGVIYMNEIRNYDKKVDKVVLVVNGAILGVVNKDDDEPIEKLLDILFEKYPEIDICNGDECWYVATRKDAWEYLDVHEGMTAFIADTKYNGELLDILICEEFYKYNLDKEYENDKTLLEYFENEEKEEKNGENKEKTEG